MERISEKINVRIRSKSNPQESLALWWISKEVESGHKSKMVLEIIKVVMHLKEKHFGSAYWNKTCKETQSRKKSSLQHMWPRQACSPDPCTWMCTWPAGAWGLSTMDHACSPCTVHWRFLHGLRSLCHDLREFIMAHNMFCMIRCSSAFLDKDPTT